VRLEYEAYRSMALKKLQHICERIKDQYKVLCKSSAERGRQSKFDLLVRTR
jgi:molybdopterin synthase catalytic subunit